MPAALALIEDAAVTSGRPVLAVRGELDVDTVAALRDWLTTATDAGRRSAVVDLTAVRFLAAGALHALCDEQERLLDEGEGLTLVCSNPQLLHLFELVELDAVFDIVATRGEAGETHAHATPSAHLSAWVERREAGRPLV